MQILFGNNLKPFLALQYSEDAKSETETVLIIIPILCACLLIGAAFWATVRFWRGNKKSCENLVASGCPGITAITPTLDLNLLKFDEIVGKFSRAIANLIMKNIQHYKKTFTK